MREYQINVSACGISRWAYEELKAFCRQYPEKKAEANALLGIRGGSHVTEYRDKNGSILGTVLPKGNMTSNPVEDVIIKRMRLLEDCELIERIAAETDEGKWKDALILNVCYGKGYKYIDPALLVSSHRNAFFRARREFFFRLQEAKIRRERRE